jgi:hypothetical protein
LWIDQPNDDSYILTSIVANSATWINTGGGTGVFNAITVTTTATIGTTLEVGGAVTLSALGLGVVQSSAAGVLSSSDGTDGQLLIASTGAGAPAWASITSATLVITPGAGTLNIEESGGTANSYVTDVGGPVAPLVGVLDVLGGTNMTTDGTVANTVTIDLDDNVTLVGGLTAGVDLTMSSGTCTITSDQDAVRSIYLHANGGTNESIDLRSQLGTALDSVSVLSDVGGVSITAGVANAGAITILTGAAAGGIDIDSGTGGIAIDSTGAISLGAAAASDFTVTGAFDLTLASTLGSVVIDGGEAANDAVQIAASNAAGGLDFTSGTGGISIVAANGTVGIESGTGALNVGTDATVHTVTVGSTTGAADTVIQSGTGNTSITSTGTIDLDATGNVSMNSTAGTLNVGNDADAFAINVGTGAAARVITVGNVTGASQVVLNSGTAGIQLTSTGAGDITIDSDDTVLIDADGVLELNSSAGVIGIGNDADAFAINVGTGAAARVITMGNVTGATQVVLNSGTAGVSINSTGAGDIECAAGDAIRLDAVGVLELNSSAGIIGIGNDADAFAINVGTGAAARTITMGNVTGATALALNAGTGAIAITATNSAISLNSGTGAVNIGTDAAAHSVIVGSTTGAADTTIQSGTGGITMTTATGDFLLTSSTGAINIGTDAAAHTVTMGSVTGAAATVVQAGTGDLELTSVDAIFADCVGVLELNSTGGAIGIGNDANAQAVNIGTGAANRTVTVGSTNTTSTTTVQSGTGGISLEAAGIVDMVPATATVAGVGLTINANVGVGTFTGQVTASAASQVFTITNSVCTVGSAILVSASNLGGNDAQMTVTRVTPGAGSFTVTLTNNGAAALNGDVIITFWIIAA